jgi:hypothetical protein
MGSLVRIALLLPVLGITGLLGYHLESTSYNAAQKPDDPVAVFTRDFNDCSLDRAVGFFFDDHLDFHVRLGRVVDASLYGDCVNYADKRAAKRINDNYCMRMSEIKGLPYCDENGDRINESL